MSGFPPLGKPSKSVRPRKVASLSEEGVALHQMLESIFSRRGDSGDCYGADILGRGGIGAAFPSERAVDDEMPTLKKI